MNHPVTGFGLAIVIAGLALSTFITRGSFLIAGARLRLHPRVESALRYAPVCTLMAIIVPDVLLHGGTDLDLSLLNPRLVGVLASALWLTRSRNIIGCLASGMLAFTLARVYLSGHLP
jgi:branched-subunit amino acid transport protein